jgi:zinc protease
MTLTRALAPPLPPRPGDSWDRPPLTAVTATLANGLRVVMAENHTVPLVWLNWVSQAGSEWDPPAIDGLALSTSLLMREGTARRSARQIVEEIDDLGATLLSGADWEAAYLNVELLAEDFRAGIDLVMDMACHARFPGAAVDRLKQRQIGELTRTRHDVRALADQGFARVLYGETTYGRSRFGTEASLARISAADVAAFHQTFYQRAHSCLVLVGSFDSAHAADLLSEWEFPSVAAARPPLPQQSGSTREPGAHVTLLNVPHAKQLELRVGHIGVGRDSTDLPALEVLNAVLGRGPSSRLARALRQHQGLTYHVRSSVQARRDTGSFAVETAVAPGSAPAALTAIRHELATLCEEQVPIAEVERAKRGLLGAELQRLQSIRGLGVTLGPAALEENPLDQFERRRQHIAAIEPERVQEVARRHVHPERLLVVAAGPITALDSRALDSQFFGSCTGHEPRLPQTTS